MSYCSKECQTKDWNDVHKFKECEYLAGDQIKDLEQMKFSRVLRFILKCKYEPGLLDKQFVLFDGRTKKIDDLMHHVGLILQDEDLEAFNTIGERFIRLGFIDSMDNFLMRFSQILVNGFGIETSGWFFHII